MIKTLVYGFACLLLLLSAMVSAQTEQQPIEDEAACVRYEHGWRDGDVARDQDTRIDPKLFSEHEGKKIRKVLFNNIDVFNENNPDENNSLYRFLNKLHINTQPIVIRSQLLFEEGDLVDVQKIEESARILRTRNYLTTAYILPEANCGDAIDILVVTQDSWSLEPEVSFSQNADDSESGFALSDDNVLGTGNSVSIGYEKDADRSSIRYSFSNPHFLNKPLAVKLSFAETSDGDNSSINISRPFYSLNTPWATGIQLEDNSEVSIIRSGGEVINEYRHQQIYQEAYFGIASDITPTHTRRLYVGLTKEEDDFFEIDETVLGIPEYRKAVYPWIGYQFIENKFGVFKNVNQIQRAEDIALGLNVDFRIGYGGTSLDSADELFRYKGKITNVLDVSDTHILEMSAEFDGRYNSNSGNKDSSVIGGELAYNYFINDKNRWYFRTRFDVGQDLLQHEQLTVGDITGMRGYPTDFQRGDKRYIINLERRYFSDIHLFNLVRMGGVVFFDVGRAWDNNDEVSNPVLVDVGFGLRLSSSKVRVGNVIHIDVAAPLTARDGVSDFQVLVGAEQRF